MDGLVVYPAAGMIVMAIEAARQLAKPMSRISGYKATNLQFLQALKIPPSPDGIETQLHLHPLKETNRTSDVYNFELHRYSNETWAVVCSGTIAAEYATEGADDDGNEESSIESLRYSGLFQNGSKRCNQPITTSQFYLNLANYGCEFGPMHRVLEHIQYDDAGRAKASICLDDWVTKVSSDMPQAHVIHPTALDGILQLSLAALSHGSWKVLPTMVPTNVESIWVSHSLLDRSIGAKLHAYAETMFQGYREADFRVVAVDDDGNAKISVENWREMAVTSLDAFQSEGSSHRQLFYNLTWMPDVELLTPVQIADHCQAAVSNSSRPLETFVDRLELVTLKYMSDCLTVVHNEELNGLSQPMLKYVEWIKHSFHSQRLEVQMAKDQAGWQCLTDPDRCKEFLDDFSTASAEGALTREVGDHMLDLIQGKKDPLDLLFSKGLVQAWYHSTAFAVSYQKIASYIKLLAHKNPSIRILEVGAGTGAATALILQEIAFQSNDFGQRGDNLFERYDYTDISPSFFEQAKERYTKLGDSIRFMKLDIEEDPCQQGFEAHGYDVIVCGLVSNTSSFWCCIRDSVTSDILAGSPCYDQSHINTSKCSKSSESVNVQSKP